MATDSSEVGYGVCERELPVPLVSRTGRVCERWRYAVEGAVKAHMSALGKDVFEPPLEELCHECARLHQSDFELAVCVGSLAVACGLQRGLDAS